MPKNTNHPTLHLFPALLGFFSLLRFLLKTGKRTAYDWPAIDMFNFFERYFNPDLLKNGFFTNASMEPNVRHVFGYIVIFLSKIFNCDWYHVFFAIKVLFVSGLPVLIYYSLLALWRNNLPDNHSRKLDICAQITFLVFIAIIIKKHTTLSIAWWPALNLIAAPQTLAFFFGFIGTLIYALNRQNNFRFLSIIAFFSATLVHPTLGISAIIFTFVTSYKNRKEIKDFIIIFIGGFLLPALALEAVFASSEKLSTQEFIKFYVMPHSFHYVVTQFANFKNYSWIYNFAAVNLVFLACIMLGLKKNDRQLITISLLSFLSYSGCVLIQYLGIEVFPSKAVAIIGISRFSMYGYWMMAVTTAMSLKHIPNRIIEKIFNPKIEKLLKKSDNKILLIFLAILSIYTAVNLVDDPIESHSNELTKWVVANSSKDSLFAVNSELKLDINVIAQRRLVHGIGFPFNEKFLRKHYERGYDLYSQEAEFDRSTKKRFLELQQKYKFDYLIIKTEMADPSMKKIKPTFQWKEYSVYRASDLR